jgi:hypothetical protein
MSVLGARFHRFAVAKTYHRDAEARRKFRHCLANARQVEAIRWQRPFFCAAVCDLVCGTISEFSCSQSLAWLCGAAAVAKRPPRGTFVAWLRFLPQTRNCTSTFRITHTGGTPTFRFCPTESAFFPELSRRRCPWLPLSRRCYHYRLWPGPSAGPLPYKREGDRGEEVMIDNESNRTASKLRQFSRLRV